MSSKNSPEVHPAQPDVEIQAILDSVPIRFFRANDCFPLRIGADSELVLGVPEDGIDSQILDNLRLQIDRTISTTPMGIDEIQRVLNEWEHRSLAEQSEQSRERTDHLRGEFQDQTDSARQTLDTSEEAPIAGMVNSIIAEAVLQQASDIHFEPREDEIQVRFRRNGMLMDHDSLARDILPGVISRIKVMSELDIAEQHIPQDGRMNLDIGNKQIDVRVSLVPTVHGERAVLRILDRDTLKFSLSELGLGDRELPRVRELIGKKDGTVLLTGPTGSGKTTTLYCFLHQLRESQRNIITLEDPVEYRLDGINQIEIKPARDLTFSSGLRSVLRQDPDIIMVGEIRDRESARLAMNASLTGHLVFSTLHTRNSAGAISRLVDLGLDPYLIGAGVNGVIAQRLVRILCNACKEKHGEHFRAVGCDECGNTGFQGRTGIFEILTVDDTIRNLLEHGEEESIREHLNQEGFTTLQDQGQQLIDEGKTSPEELTRVLDT